MQSLARAGTLAIIWVYPKTVQSSPIGMVMMKNLTMQMGNCNHRKYIPLLIDLVRSGAVDPTRVLTQTEPLTSAIEAFNARQPGWIKVELAPVP